MERTTLMFKSCYDNDTVIEYVNTGLYSMLNCSFTSEDPDYGTDTLHYGADHVEPMERLAFDMYHELATFLEDRENLEDPHVDYDEYGRSSLIAIEDALAEIAQQYNPDKWYMTIADASEIIAGALLRDPDTVFSFTDSDSVEAKTDPEKHGDNGPWFGIKRVRNMFDDGDGDFVIACGQWGGGAFAFGYESEGYESEFVGVVRKAIINATDWDSDNYIYIEKEKGVENK